MLGCIANKQRRDDKGVKYIYTGLWINNDKRTEKKYFKFALVQDDNTEEKDFNNLSATEGQMRIVTKSTIPFKIDDVIISSGQKYHIVIIDGNRKLDGEQAYARVKVNGNLTISLLLRKAG